MAARPNLAVTATSPPAVGLQSKTIQIARTDTTAFDAFVQPQGTILVGVYVLGLTASDSATSAIIAVGTNPGTTDDALTAFDVKTVSTSVGYFAAGNKGGTGLGTLTTAPKLMKAKYTEVGVSATGGPWLVRVEYYYPQAGMPY